MTFDVTRYSVVMSVIGNLTGLPTTHALHNMPVIKVIDGNVVVYIVTDGKGGVANYHLGTFEKWYYHQYFEMFARQEVHGKIRIEEDEELDYYFYNNHLFNVERK